MTSRCKPVCWRYRVRIAYREPTFELYAGLGPRVRYGYFETIARNDDDAIANAVRRFRQLEVLSWVGWPRDVESVTAVREDDEP